MPFPNIAKIGMIKRKITGTPPRRFPTNISGLLSAIAVSPTANSGDDVRIPRIINETAKVESLNFRENLSVEETIRPAPIHIKINEEM